MQCERRAVIDIGTNSVKLLVGDVSGRRLDPIHETSNQTRLGHGFYETHILQPEAIRQTAIAVSEFAAEAKRLAATSIKLIATSAVRDARNGHELAKAILLASGLPLRIITGDEEADYAYKGVQTDPKFAAAPLLLLDMGGGSTEFVLGHRGNVWFRHSFAIGTLRLMDALQISDPPVNGELGECNDRITKFLRTEVRPLLGPALEKISGTEVLLVGTGGTAGILARIDSGLHSYDRVAMESVIITRERMHRHTKHLWSLPIEQRRQIVGLPPRRADVILTGSAAYLRIMEEFGLESLRVSTRGLRFAVLLEPAQ